MVENKKTATVKPVVKAVTEKPVAKVAEVKKEEPVKEVKPVAEKKPAAKKETVKKEAAKKETTKKDATKKATAKKEEVKATVQVEYADKKYTTEALIQIAKDVWKYDLNQKVADFKTVELYVKPEESKVYYVINGDVKGDFAI